MANQYTKTKTNEQVVRDYEKGDISLTLLSKKYNVSRKIITRWIKENNISIKNLNNRSVNYNEFIFDDVNTEEKAYWLGFIAADGYVSDNNNFELSLSIKDIAHLEKFGKFFNIPVKKDHYRCRVCLSNKHLKESLGKYNIIPRKSLVLEFAHNIPSSLIRHYIRGYFDGDGTIYVGVKNKEPDRIMSSAYIRFLGTLDFLKNVQKHIDVSSTIVKRYDENIYSLEITGARMMIHASDYMYKDATIYLERKQNKYCRLKQKCLRVLVSKYGGRCESQYRGNFKFKEVKVP